MIHSTESNSSILIPLFWWYMKPIIRFSVPCRYDRAPYNTMLVVINEEEKHIGTYIQINNDQGDPKWVEMGVLLKHVFASDSVDDEKRHKWIQLYASKVGSE